MTELSRPIALDRVGPHGTAYDIEAGPQELAAVAARLGVPSVRHIDCSFRLRRLGGSLIEAEGVLHAAVEQVCVVTLEPFVQDLRDEFTVHFVPAGTEDDDPEPDSVDQIPYEGSVIDLGEAAVEQLALSLDPYPRRDGATLDADAGDAPAGPFAALSALRDRQG